LAAGAIIRTAKAKGEVEARWLWSPEYKWTLGHGERS